MLVEPKDMTVSCAVVSRNDGVENLKERFVLCINGLLNTFDEVVYVDWGSMGTSLVDATKDYLMKTGRLRYFIVSPEQVDLFVKKDESSANEFCQNMARNISIRRCTKDFIVSTNIDIVVPSRRCFNMAFQDDVFYTIPRRDIDITHFAHVIHSSIEVVQAFVEEVGMTYKELDAVRLFPEDEWSLVCGCGDFQIAHRNIWFSVKGFEESLRYGFYADTNVQKKAVLGGFGLKALWHQFPIMHITHPIRCNRYNSVDDAVRCFTHTTNKDSWGFEDIVFPGGQM